MSAVGGCIDPLEGGLNGAGFRKDEGALARCAEFNAGNDGGGPWSLSSPLSLSPVFSENAGTVGSVFEGVGCAFGVPSGDGSAERGGADVVLVLFSAPGLRSILSFAPCSFLLAFVLVVASLSRAGVALFRK
jgi:hypothetical protein